MVVDGDLAGTIDVVADDGLAGDQGLRERAGQGRRVALFTSGGFIGCAAQWALAAPDRTALELNWRIRNCSLTEFVFTRDRFTLDAGLSRAVRECFVRL